MTGKSSTTCPRDRKGGPSFFAGRLAREDRSGEQLGSGMVASRDRFFYEDFYKSTLVYGEAIRQRINDDRGEDMKGRPIAELQARYALVCLNFRKFLSDALSEIFEFERDESLSCLQFSPGGCFHIFCAAKSIRCQMASPNTNHRFIEIFVEETIARSHHSAPKLFAPLTFASEAPYGASRPALPLPRTCR